VLIEWSDASQLRLLKDALGEEAPGKDGRGVRVNMPGFALVSAAQRQCPVTSDYPVFQRLGAKSKKPEIAFRQGLETSLGFPQPVQMLSMP
jgi:hypothetical protein